MKFDEKKFNRAFSAFILVGMAVCVIVSSAFKLETAQSGKLLILITAFGALCGVASTVLASNGRILTFFFGLLDVAIYSFILFDSHMPAQFLLHIGYLIPMQFIGFFQWRKRGADASNAVKARRLHGRSILWYSLLFVAVFAVSFAVSCFIAQKAGDPLDTGKAALDAAATTGNIVAIVMMAFAYMEQWYLWLVVNVSSIAIWLMTLRSNPEAGYAVIPLIKYIFYLINSVNGIRVWYALSRDSERERGLENS